MIQVNTTPEGSSQPQKAAAKAAAGTLTPAAGQDNSVMDVLENTLWNRQLGVMSEEIVAALVCQIFEGNPISLHQLPPDASLKSIKQCQTYTVHDHFGKADRLLSVLWQTQM